jgi:transcriptional regulator with XRE-family HTH domain
MKKKPEGETMGTRLKRLRQAAGLSQPQLANRAGIPVGTIRSLEQERRVPRLDTASALADAIGCSLDELAGRGGEAPAAKKPKK